MSKFWTIMCLILSLAGCWESGRPLKNSYKTTAKHQFESVPSTKYKASKKTTIIAVIDTGFGADDTWTGQETAHLCKFGHKNFVDSDNSLKFGTKDPVPKDKHGHGTHMAGIIDTYAKRTNESFCLVILKYYDERGWGNENLNHTVEAIQYARQIHADYINYSGGGVQKSQAETEAVKAFIDSGGTFVAAAGNEKSNTSFFPYYPAQDDERVISVGNGNDENHRAPSSNYGKKVKRWENGVEVQMYNHRMTGTSQAAAIATGKIVAEKNKSCK